MLLHIFLPSFVESQNFYSLSETYTIRCSSLPKFWWHHPDRPCLLLFLTWINLSLFPRRDATPLLRTYCYAAFGSLTFGPDDTLTSVGKTSSSDASSNCDCVMKSLYWKNDYLHFRKGLPSLIRFFIHTLMENSKRKLVQCYTMRRM